MVQSNQCIQRTMIDSMAIKISEIDRLKCNIERPWALKIQTKKTERT